MDDVVNIVVLGSIYGLYAAGFTLVFGLFDVLNLAHAAVFAFAAVFAMFLTTDGGMPLLEAAAIAVAASAVIGLLVERAAFRPLRYRGRTAWGRHIGPLVTSLGAASILAGMSQIWFGISPRQFPEGALLHGGVTIAGTRVETVDLIAIGLLIAVFGGLWLLLDRTRWGLEVRAAAEAPRTIALFGVNVERRVMELFALAAGLGGVAGVVWALQFDTASPDTASQVDIRGFAVIILGGMGSIPGALLGAAFLAASEVLSVRWFPAGWQPLLAYTALFAMLLLRPQGILGRGAVGDRA